MSDLSPMGPIALHEKLIGSSFYNGEANHPGDNIVATFKALSEQFEDDASKLKAADKRDLFECCLYLSFANTLGVGDQARGCLILLTQKNPKFKFRQE